MGNERQITKVQVLHVTAVLSASVKHHCDLPSWSAHRVVHLRANGVIASSEFLLSNPASTWFLMKTVNESVPPYLTLLLDWLAYFISLPADP